MMKDVILSQAKDLSLEASITQFTLRDPVTNVGSLTLFGMTARV
jgi:hypothetical protein